MKKIRFNIADQKKINLTRLIVLAIFCAILSLGFIATGVYQLVTNANQFQHDKAKLQQLKDKANELKKRETEQNKKITQVKSTWGKKISLINQLIETKNFPYLPILDKLETILPSGVFLQNILLNPKNGDKINITIAAMSYQKLLESYKALLKYNLVIITQVESNGLFSASVIIRLKNETQSK